MSILVTGSSGFIGSHLMERLDNAIGYDIKNGQDVRDREQFRSYLKRVDTVIHLAANTSVKQAWDDPTELYSNNIMGTSVVIEECIKAKIKRIIFASSASVKNPNANPYAFSKFTCEGLFKTRKDEINCLTFRFMNVYGKGQNPNYGTVIPAFYNGINKGEIDIYGDGSFTRDYIHVDDIVIGIKRGLGFNHRNRKFVVMELGTGVETSVYDLAHKMQKLMNKKIKVNYLPERKEVDHSVADTHVAKFELGFEALIDMNHGLKRVIKEGI